YLATSASILLRPPPLSTLFPYTTLFRSYLKFLYDSGQDHMLVMVYKRVLTLCPNYLPDNPGLRHHLALACRDAGDSRNAVRLIRSEEHTSELQSRENLVCRLLLEKKKKK